MRLLTALIAASLLLAGCAGGARTVNLPVRGVAPMNTNDAKESLPVDVRVYPLGSDAKFRSATVDQLWTDAKTALGADLLAAPFTITVYPGSAADSPVMHKLELPPATTHLGILAMYQGSEAQDHRALLVPVDEGERRGFLFTGYGVALYSSQPATTTAPASSPAAR